MSQPFPGQTPVCKADAVAFREVLPNQRLQPAVLGAAADPQRYTP